MNLLSIPALAFPVHKHQDYRDRIPVQLLWLLPAWLANIAQWLVGFVPAAGYVAKAPLDWRPWAYLVLYWFLDVGVNTIFLGGDPRTSISLRTHRLRADNKIAKFVIRMTEHVDDDHGAELYQLPYGYGTTDNRKLMPVGVLTVVEFWIVIAIWGFL